VADGKRSPFTVDGSSRQFRRWNLEGEEPMSMHAVRVRAANAAEVTVISNTREITEYARREVHPWWTSSRLLPESVCEGPVVIADIDPEAVADLAKRAADGCPPRSGDVTTVVDAGQGLAYRYEPDPGTVTIYGCHVGPLAEAATAYLRESMGAALLKAGWAFLRASAVVRNGRTVLICANEAAGKTAAALTLAARRGWSLLGDDRVFVRPEAGGHVRVLPWPAPVAVGLPLLDGLGWSARVRTRLQAGQPPHPAQDERVTEALLAGRCAPVIEGERELKSLFSPGRLHDWFDIPMAATAHAVHGIVFAHLRPGTAPAAISTDRELRRYDFPARHEAAPRPEPFSLMPDDDEDSPATALRDLAALPRTSVALGHDAVANAAFLHHHLAATLVPARLPQTA
jgi:hypothetical protein